MLLPVAGLAQLEADPYNTYRWEGQHEEWYEWWYYKVVDPDTNEAFFFTYGVVNPGDSAGKKKGTKSLVQAGSFSQMISVERDFPLSAFSAQKNRVEVKVGENIATDQRLSGNIQDDAGNPISWDLELKKEWGFDAMGWGMRNPHVSGIYWYPAQASARMSGRIHFRGKDYILRDAPAYQDRNWGRRFPKWWTWLVSNHFQDSPGTTLAAGGGKPHVFNAAPLFTGLCIGLLHEGKEYVFRTTDGHRVSWDIRWGKWEVSAVNNSGQKIEISAFAPQEKFLLLPFTTPQGSMFYDYEALSGKMRVKLSEREGFGWKTIADLHTDQAGIEWGSPEPVDLGRLTLKLQ